MPYTLKKTVAYLATNYQNLKSSTVFWLLFAAAFFIRFPFFFRDYVDRDESTFIIMAQSWVDGHLPYTQLWDLKPPIIFLVFALIIKLFGKSFLAIRLVGMLFVTLTAFFTFKIAKRTVSLKHAFWAAVLTVVLQSLFGSLQGFMSEHICVAFFMIALYFLLYREKWYWFLFSGVLFGLSLLSKLNVGYPLLFLVVYLIWEGHRLRQLSQTIQNLFWLGLGIVVVILLTAIPYYLTHETWLLWQSVFMAPLAYTSSRPSALIKVALFFLIVSVWLVWSFKKGWLDFGKRKLRILAIVIFGMVFSFLQTGKFNGHYLILLYPSLLILLGIFVSKLKWMRKLNRPVFLFFVCLLIPMESYLEYANIVQNKLSKGSFFNGEGIDVPKYLTENQLNTKNILFFEYHIGYWVLGEKPPTKAATHPSNILRESIFPFMENPRKTGMEELTYLMETVQPPLVVTRRNRRVFDKKMAEANAYINAYLEKNYRKLDSVDAALIHKRLK